MTLLKKRTAHAMVRLLLLLVAILSTPYPVSAETRGTRDTMQVIFENLQILLDLSATEAKLSVPQNGPPFLDAAFAIEEQSALLSDHIGPGPDAAFLSSTLSRSAFRVGRFYEFGDLETVRFLVQRMTDTCVACHTRQLSGDSPVAADFIASTPVQSLNALEHARLQIATRRFDDALDTLELILNDPTVEPQMLRDALNTFLAVAIRVKNDLDRAIRVLAGIDLERTPTLRPEVDAWVLVFGSSASKPAVDTMDAAFTYVDQGERLEHDALGAGTASFLLASGMLQRMVDAESIPPKRIGEAYYLLGVTEFKLNTARWIPRAELFLELAILNAPGSEMSKRAYLLLDEKVTEAHVVLGWVKLPDDVRAHLEHLKGLAFGV